MRKSPQERVAEYKAKAETIERREARKLRAKSPQWKATVRAIGAMVDALAVIEERNGEIAAGEDAKLVLALQPALASLVFCRAAQIDKE